MVKAGTLLFHRIEGSQGWVHRTKGVYCEEQSKGFLVCLKEMVKSAIKLSKQVKGAGIQKGESCGGRQY